MVSIFVRATSCLSCSESQVCAEQHGSPCGILHKGLFVHLYRDKSAQWLVMYFFPNDFKFWPLATNFWYYYEFAGFVTTQHTQSGIAAEGEVSVGQFLLN